MKKKILIGRTDIAGFPEFDIEEIPIKMDTGAYTSSLHCHHIEELEIDGVRKLFIHVLDPSHPKYNPQAFIFDKYRSKIVKNSFGISEERFVIRTKILLFKRKYSIELSLSERSGMRFPVLIGRKLLMGKFLVDPSQTDLSYNGIKTRINTPS